MARGPKGGVSTGVAKTTQMGAASALLITVCTPSTMCTNPTTVCSTPSTLCSTPSTLCSTPSTLCSTPSTLCGTPGTLCGTPSTLRSSSSSHPAVGSNTWQPCRWQSHGANPATPDANENPSGDRFTFGSPLQEALRGHDTPVWFGVHCARPRPHPLVKGFESRGREWAGKGPNGLRTAETGGAPIGWAHKRPEWR